MIVVNSVIKLCAANAWLPARVLSSGAFHSVALVVVIVLAGCSGAAGKASQREGAYSIQVTVSGLLGAGLVFKNNGTDELHAASDGVYQFPAVLVSGSAYSVTVAAQPLYPRQVCSITRGIGEIANTNVTDMRIDCVDNFPPAVTNVAPQSGTTMLSPDDALAVVFDDPVNSQTIGAQSFTVYDANNHSVPGSFDFPATDRVRFTPQQPWNLASTYRIAMTTEVKDTAGNPLPKPYDAQFSIRDGVWSERVDTGSVGTVASPVGHVLDNGDFNFLWSSIDTGVTSLNARTYTRKTKAWSKLSTTPQPDRAAYATTRGTGNVTVVGPLVGGADLGPLLAIDLVNGAWLPKAIDLAATSLPLNLGGGDAKRALSVASNATGDMLVTWEQSGLSSYQTRANIYHQQAWSSDAFIVSKLRQDASVQAAAIDAFGNAAAIWQDSDLSMRAKHYRPASGWETDERIIGQAQPQGALIKQIAYDASGNAVAVWGYGSGSNSCCSKIVANDYRAGTGGWYSTTGTPVYTPTVAVTDLKLNVNPNGDASLVWIESAGTLAGYRNIRASWFTQSSHTWSTPAFLGIYDGDYRSAVLDNGEVVVAYANFTSLSGILSAAVFKDGKWSASKSLSQSLQEQHLIGPVALARNASRVLAAWPLAITTTNTAVDHSIWISVYSDGSWSPDPVPVYKGASENIVATSVNAVLDAFGNAVVAWCVDRGDATYDMFAIRLANGVWQTQPDKLNDVPAKDASLNLAVDKMGNTTAFWNEGGKYVLRRFE